MKITRRKTKIIKVGNIYIGGNHPIAVQSMAKTKTSDIEKTARQIKELGNAGCEIVRLAIKDSADVKALRKIKQDINIPIVADIHFDWRLAINAIDNGADKIRLNPGNIYKKEQIREIVRAAKLARIPIRVGVNSGSVRSLKAQVLRRKSQDKRYGAGDMRLVTAMVESTLEYIKILESFRFYDIVVSLKASSVLDTIEAYRKAAKLFDYPFHLGVTATGLPYSGIIKSSIALGALLSEGIGDTIRISLTDKPQEEVKVAQTILEALGLRHFGPEIISCPTCGRCEVDLVKIVKELEKKLWTIDHRLWTHPMKLAVMGCVVNGPGEAKEADLGIAFGRSAGLLFKKGKSIRKVSSNRCVATILKEMLESS
jgi:(E)-4-hydroxy-3-methylbut-2-enyl-diphosphate synthase